MSKTRLSYGLTARRSSNPSTTNNLLNSPSNSHVKKRRDSFLDVKLTEEGGKIFTGVHRKSTHTDRYIQFSSYHHPRIMSGVVRCLKRRADLICDEHSLKPELQHLQRTFEANGYPSRLVRHTFNQTTTCTSEETDQTDDEDEEKPKLTPPNT